MDIATATLAGGSIGCRLFSSLDYGALSCIVARASILRVERGTILLRQGDRPNTLFLLKTGTTKVFRVTDEGRQTTLCLVRPGEFIAGASLFRDAILPASAVALETSEVYSWPKDQFNLLMEGYPQLAINALALISEQLDQMALRDLSRGTDPVPKRLAAELLRLSQRAKVNSGVREELRLTRQELGELIGATLFTVSRVLTGWSREQIVESGRQSVVIRDRSRLARIAAGCR